MDVHFLMLILLIANLSGCANNDKKLLSIDEIKIDVTRGGAPVPEVSFLTNYGTLSDSALIGEKNNALFFLCRVL